ncbi:hypothetical protein NX059_012293 [Plenodomus lindquistii]|nr:hypothetical protein NX059_012293 [Plenodomus lindquistii]
MWVARLCGTKKPGKSVEETSITHAVQSNVGLMAVFVVWQVKNAWRIERNRKAPFARLSTSELKALLWTSLCFYKTAPSHYTTAIVLNINAQQSIMAAPAVRIVKKFSCALKDMNHTDGTATPSVRDLCNTGGLKFRSIYGNRDELIEGGHEVTVSELKRQAWVWVGVVYFNDPELPMVESNHQRAGHSVFAAFSQDNPGQIHLDSNRIPIIQFFTYGVDESRKAFEHRQLVVNSLPNHYIVLVKIHDLSAIHGVAPTAVQSLWRRTYGDLYNLLLRNNPGIKEEQHRETIEELEV